MAGKATEQGTLIDELALLGWGDAPFARFMANLPGLAWIKDHAGRYVYANRLAQEAFGKTAAELYGRTDAEIFPPGTAEQFVANDRAVLTGGADVKVFETLTHPDGVAHYSVVSKFLIKGPPGGPDFVGGIAIDITERKQAEETLRESEERYRALVESQSDMLCRFRPDGTIVFANGAYARARGATVEALLRRSFWDFVAEEDRPALKDTLDRLTPDTPEVRSESRFAAADGERWILWANRGLKFDRDGRLLEAQTTGVDITERKKAEEVQRALVSELNHRVKNTLAVVQSIAAQTARFTPDLKAFKGAFSERIVALSRVHDLLAGSSWEDASLTELAAACLAPFRAYDEDVLLIDGPPVRLSTNIAVSISLALHELATNAAKHGALKARAGRVTLNWKVDRGEPAMLDMAWTERGGPPVEPLIRQGFGSRLIAGLALQLNAEVRHEFARDGVSCQIRMPYGRGMASMQ